MVATVIIAQRGHDDVLVGAMMAVAIVKVHDINKRSKKKLPLLLPPLHLAS